MKIGIYQSYWGVVGGGQRYIAVVAAALAQDADVEIVHHQPEFDPRAVEEPMQVDLSRVGFRYEPQPESPAWSTRNPLKRLRMEREVGRELSEPYDVFIDSSDKPPYFCHARSGVLLTHFPLISFDDFHGITGDDARQRPLPVRWMASVFHNLEWRRRFGTYRLFIVNSQFTRHWTKRLWGVDAQVLNPPLRGGLSPQPKEPFILTIGAFRHVQHKKHSVTIRAFCKMCDDGLEDWKYVLVGACGENPDDRAYVERLREIADGYPVEIITDASGDELESLLERASMLWHSMGYGVDAQKAPRLMEHFGMVATEAMAAGAVPVVFNGGGLREIVTDGQDGFLWSTTDQLCDRTKQLVDDEHLRERLGRQAVNCSQKYTRDAFERRLHEILSPVLNRDGM